MEIRTMSDEQRKALRWNTCAAWTAALVIDGEPFDEPCRRSRSIRDEQPG